MSEAAQYFWIGVVAVLGFEVVLSAFVVLWMSNLDMK